MHPTSMFRQSRNRANTLEWTRRRSLIDSALKLARAFLKFFSDYVSHLSRKVDSPFSAILLTHAMVQKIHKKCQIPPIAFWLPNSCNLLQRSVLNRLSPLEGPSHANSRTAQQATSNKQQANLEAIWSFEQYSSKHLNNDPFSQQTSCTHRCTWIRLALSLNLLKPKNRSRVC